MKDLESSSWPPWPKWRGALSLFSTQIWSDIQKLSFVELEDLGDVSGAQISCLEEE
jgi:hypothetical protein